MKICCSQSHPAGTRPQQSLVNPSRRQLLAWGAAAAPCLCCPPPPPAVASEWTYGGPEGVARWPGVCATGTSQSPVAIPAPSSAATAPLTSQALLPRYPRKSPSGGITVQNNGHGSPQVNFPRGEYTLEVGNRSYSLVQFHFHTPSEHSTGGEHAPIEAHLVHKDEENGELAVLAVLIREGRAGNAALGAALAGAPAEPGRDAAVPLRGGVDVRSLLPAKLQYATYFGSLTTPPCTEGVRWLVLEAPVSVSPSQVLALQRFSSQGTTLDFNSRPEQPLNGREIQFYL